MLHAEVSSDRGSVGGFVAFEGNIIEKTKEENEHVDRSKLEAALTAKQEADAKLSSYETKCKMFEMEISELKAKVRFSTDV